MIDAEKNRLSHEDIKFNISAVSRLHNELADFSRIINKKIERLEDDIDEILIANNKELLDSVKRAEDDIKAERVTI